MTRPPLGVESEQLLPDELVIEPPSPTVMPSSLPDNIVPTYSVRRPSTSDKTDYTLW